MFRNIPMAYQAAIAVVFTTLVVAVLLAIVVLPTVHQTEEANAQRHVVDTAQLVAAALDVERMKWIVPGSEGEKTYQNSVDKLAAAAAATATDTLVLLDKEGRVVVDNRGKLLIGSFSPRASLDAQVIHKALQGMPIASEAYTAKDGRVFLSAYAPVWFKDGNMKDEQHPITKPLLQYVVYVEAPRPLLTAMKNIQTRLIPAVLVLTTLGAVLAWILARWVLRPLQQLLDSSQPLSEGNLEKTLHVPDGPPELAHLSTTLERMRQALLQRDKERQMMLASIAHEVRNPLGGMELFVGLQKETIDELNDDDIGIKKEITLHNDKIHKELRYLSRVVNDFLVFARETPLVTQNVDAEAMTQEVLSLISPPSFVKVSQGSVLKGFVNVDPVKLKQALHNVLNNAVEACALAGSEKHYEVKLSAEVRKFHNIDYVVWSVEDNGPGIAESVLSQLNQPFFTTKEKGSGLGLHIVKKITQQHGGKVEIHSVEAKGTTIEICIPIKSTNSPSVHI